LDIPLASLEIGHIALQPAQDLQKQVINTLGHALLRSLLGSAPDGDNKHLKIFLSYAQLWIEYFPKEMRS
jgi:hypothetical protein